MSIEITVPALPESVADALLLDWKHEVGARVARDEILVEVETDKIVLEVAAPDDGVLTEILQAAGATVTAGQALAKFEVGAAADDTVSATAPADAVDDDAPTADDGDAAVATVDDVATADDDVVADDDADDEVTDADGALSPAARRMVEEHGLRVADIAATGPGGRVTKEDVLAFIADQVAPDDDAAPAAPTPAPTLEPPAIEPPAATPSAPAETPLPKLTPSATPSPTPSQPPQAQAQPQPQQSESQPQPPQPQSDARGETREPMSRLRRTVAARLVQAQQTAALLTTFNEVNMQPVTDLRARHKEEFERAHGTKLGLMSFFTQASVAALRKYPLVNARIDGDDIVRPNYIDIGIAVASPRGLLVPVLRDCDRLGLAEIETQIRDFGARARDGRIGIDDLTGGTFTITNGGVFGSLLSTPIINPPQSAILGMHKIEDRPIAEDGQVVIRPMMYLALSYDHRIIDGEQAVGFLITIKEALEDPARMLLQL